MNRYTIIFLLLSTPFFTQAHNLPVTIYGKIIDASEKPIEFASVYLERTSLGGSSDEQGYFSFTAPPGRYLLKASVLGYEPFLREIEITGKERHYSIHIRLDATTKQLDEVVINGKSAARHINESAYNVSALDTRLMHNSNQNLSDALGKISGIRLRENGGMGSDLSFSLNGFSGKHVKVFMDGVPMEGFGSSFQLNNIPINMAERIEVYKGVVPVAFGADALGGVVNIITRQGHSNYLDVSYSFGSFNTHKSYVNFNYTLPSGWHLQANIYQNYSKNNYPVYIHLTDQNGVFKAEETKVRRFHDTYHNEAIILRAGLRGKDYADRLVLGMVLGKNKADIQNGNNMDFVYGEKFTEGTTLMPTLDYTVKDLFMENLNFSFNGNYNFGYTRNVDTVSFRKYTWQGDWTPSKVKGENSYQLYKYRDHNGSFTSNLNYTLKEHHTITVNDVLTTFHRQGKDELATDNADNFPSVNRQNVLGINYQYHPGRLWNANLFIKHYSKYSETHIAVGNTGHYRKAGRNYRATGYGLAATLTPGKHFQAKFSYEKAYRLPTSRELFGNNDLESGNDSIQAENSHNYNLNFGYRTRIGQAHTLYTEVALTYRDIHNYIRRKVSESQGTATSANDGRIRNRGISGEIRYTYKNLLNIGGNVTYQDIRNRDKYSNGKKNLTYNDRIPNTPYFFGNADATLNLASFGGQHNTLSIGYNLQFLEEFFLRWPSYGSKDSKYTVPSQLSHDINLTYRIGDGKYNISLECNNFTDERLYDNYSLQKPGRSFSAKFRYHLQFRK